MSKKRALIVQPGKMGDVILLSPVAKHYYDQGYEIDWPVFSNFVSYFEQIPYVDAIDFGLKLADSVFHDKKRMPMMRHGEKLYSHDECVQYFVEVEKLKKENQYDLILDACWGFPGQAFSATKQAAINEYMSGKKKWITLKYKMCNVPLSERWNLAWDRDLKKEEALLGFIKKFARKKYGSEKYSIVHTYASNNLPAHEVENPINFSYIQGFEVYDWLAVLENSEKIVCVDSCLCHFVETQPSLRDKEKFYLGSEEIHWSYFMFNILTNNWTNLTKSNTTDE